MQPSSQALMDLEKKFWQSIVDKDTATAVSLLSEPALMVSSHGAMKFDHAGYRKMVEQGSMELTAFDLSEMQAVFPNDTTAVLTYRVRQEVADRGRSNTKTQEMTDTSTWIKSQDGTWRCVAHTETALEPRK